MKRFQKTPTLVCALFFAGTLVVAGCNPGTISGPDLDTEVFVGSGGDGHNTGNGAYKGGDGHNTGNHGAALGGDGHNTGNYGAALGGDGHNTGNYGAALGGDGHNTGNDD